MSSAAQSVVDHCTVLLQSPAVSCQFLDSGEGNRCVRYCKGVCELIYLEALYYKKRQAMTLATCGTVQQDSAVTSIYNALQSSDSTGAASYRLLDIALRHVCAVAAAQ
jgi:hypothetical protein